MRGDHVAQVVVSFDFSPAAAEPDF